MVQDFLTAWINWYYGNDSYPIKLQNGMTWDQKMEAISKTEQIKKIVGIQK